MTVRHTVMDSDGSDSDDDIPFSQLKRKPITCRPILAIDSDEEDTPFVVLKRRNEGLPDGRRTVRRASSDHSVSRTPAPMGTPSSIAGVSPVERREGKENEPEQQAKRLQSLDVTLQYLREGLDVNQIAQARNLNPIVIQNHVATLYRDERFTDVVSRFGYTKQARNCVIKAKNELFGDKTPELTALRARCGLTYMVIRLALAEDERNEALAKQAPKLSAVESQEVTLEMLNRGKSIVDIAESRDLSHTIVERHIQGLQIAEKLKNTTRFGCSSEATKEIVGAKAILGRDGSQPVKLQAIKEYCDRVHDHNYAYLTIKLTLKISW